MGKVVIFLCGMALGAYLSHVALSMYAQAMMGRIGEVKSQSL
jgi:hypothetical protein